MRLSWNSLEFWYKVRVDLCVNSYCFEDTATTFFLDAVLSLRYTLLLGLFQLSRAFKARLKRSLCRGKIGSVDFGLLTFDVELKRGAVGTYVHGDWSTHHEGQVDVITPARLSKPCSVVMSLKPTSHFGWPLKSEYDRWSMSWMVP